MHDPMGRRVRTLRLRHALTQQQLAERAGVSRATIAQFERGQRPPRPDTVRKVAEALGVGPMALTIGMYEMPRSGYAITGRG